MTGSFTFWFGYMNSNWEEQFDVPFGPDNYFAYTAPGALNDIELDALSPSTVDQGQPTHFYPRRNPFLFTIRVPADFGDQELVWTLTTHGRKNRVYASLRADYRMDPQVMSTEVGGAFGSLNDRLRTTSSPGAQGGRGQASARQGRKGGAVGRVRRRSRQFPPQVTAQPSTAKSGAALQPAGSGVGRGQRCTRLAADVVRLPRSCRSGALRARAAEGVDGLARLGQFTLVAAVHPA